MDPRVVFASGSPAGFDGLGVTCCAGSSPALRWFIIGTSRSPDWFRILSHCWGRTGRRPRDEVSRDHENLWFSNDLRRTVRNPLRSDRFLHSSRAACHLNLSVGNSGHAIVGRLLPIMSASSPASNLYNHYEIKCIQRNYNQIVPPRGSSVYREIGRMPRGRPEIGNFRNHEQ